MDGKTNLLSYCVNWSLKLECETLDEKELIKLLKILNSIWK